MWNGQKDWEGLQHSNARNVRESWIRQHYWTGLSPGKHLPKNPKTTPSKPWFLTPAVKICPNAHFLTRRKSDHGLNFCVDAVNLRRNLAWQERVGRLKSKNLHEEIHSFSANPAKGPDAGGKKKSIVPLWRAFRWWLWKISELKMGGKSSPEKFIPAYIKNEMPDICFWKIKK